MMRITLKTFLFCVSFLYMIPNTMHASPLDLWVPPLPALPVKSFIIIDAQTKQILAEKNKDMILPSGSLIDILTLYDLTRHNTEVRVTTQLAKTTTLARDTSVSSMILARNLLHNKNTTLRHNIIEAFYRNTPFYEECIKTIIQEHAMPSSTLMASSDFNDSLHTTASDLASMSQKMFAQLPHTVSQTEETKHSHDPRIHSMLTTSSASIHNLALYASSDEQSIIIIILGAKNNATLHQAADMLLHYAFRFYKKLDVSPHIHIPQSYPVWGGVSRQVAIMPIHNTTISVPAALNHPTTRIVWNTPVWAPIQAQQPIGSLELLSPRGVVIYTWPLLAQTEVPRSPTYYWLHYLYASLFHL